MDTYIVSLYRQSVSGRDLSISNCFGEPKFIQLRTARSARCFRWPCGCLEHANWFPSVGLPRPLEPGGLGSGGSIRPEQSQVGISDGLMGAAFLIPRLAHHGAGICTPTFTPILWSIFDPSFVGVHIPAPWSTWDMRLPLVIIHFYFDGFSMK